MLFLLISVLLFDSVMNILVWCVWVVILKRFGCISGLLLERISMCILVVCRLLML